MRGAPPQAPRLAERSSWRSIVSAATIQDRERVGGGDRTPQAAVGGPGFGFEGGEAGGISEVGRDRHRAGVAAAEHLGVDHRVPRPHVGQQASVTIARLEIELEPHRSTDKQGRVEASRADASASARPPRTPLALFMRDLRGVDADVANALDAVPQPHVDGVAIVDVHDGRGDGARHLRDRRTRTGDRQDDRGESDPEHPRATSHRSHAVTPPVGRQCPESNPPRESAQ